MPQVQAHCMMISSRNKGRLFGFFFLCYFIVYAASPLTYTYPDKKIRESSLAGDAASSVRSNIQVFLLEVIMDTVASREEHPHELPGDTILIRKKRALLPESAMTLLCREAALTAESRPVSPPRTIALCPLTHPVVRNTGTGFFSLYAGHAPPVG
jgi:hypothetical protein